MASMVAQLSFNNAAAKTPKQLRFAVRNPHNPGYIGAVKSVHVPTDPEEVAAVIEQSAADGSFNAVRSPSAAAASPPAGTASAGEHSPLAPVRPTGFPNDVHSDSLQDPGPSTLPPTSAPNTGAAGVGMPVSRFEPLAPSDSGERPSTAERPMTASGLEPEAEGVPGCAEPFAAADDADGVEKGEMSVRAVRADRSQTMPARVSGAEGGGEFDGTARGLKDRVLTLPARRVGAEGGVELEGENILRKSIRESMQLSMAASGMSSKCSTFSLADSGYLSAGGGASPVILVHVGPQMAQFHVTRETLVKMAYFKKWLARMSRDLEDPDSVLEMPLHIDTDPQIFSLILQLIRYQSFEALPELSSETYRRLRREMELLGVEAMTAARTGGMDSVGGGAAAGDDGQSADGLMTPRRRADFSYSSRGSAAGASPRHAADKTRLDFVYRHGSSKSGHCPCNTQGGHTCWLVSLPFGHVFCSECGESPTWPQKLFLELFAVASKPQPARGGLATFTSGWFYHHNTKLTVMNLGPQRQGHTCESCRMSSSWAFSSEHYHAFCVRCQAVPTNAPFLAKLFAEANMLPQ